MIHIKQYILTLVALIAMATQAWATGPEKVTQFTKELIADWKDVDVNVTLDDMQKIGLEATDATTAQAWTDVPANGQAYLFFNFQGGKITYVFFENGHVKDVPSDFITKKQIYDIVKGGMMCFYTGAPPTPFPITWDATSRNTASIAAMPAGNVEVNVEYYPQAALTTVPSAKSGVLATTDDDIISAGTVAAIGSTETKQGTLLYHVSETLLTEAQLEALTDADWSADVPKATGIIEAGTYYVYYYVKGNVGQTDETIFSDGDYNDQQVLNAPIAVEIGEAPKWKTKFAFSSDISNDEKALWSTDIPIEGVLRGDDVTITYTGDRKIIGVKAEKTDTKYMKWDAGQKTLVATEFPATVTKVENANDIVTWSAGTYLVDGDVTIGGRIDLLGDVELIIKDGAKLNTSQITGKNDYSLSVYGQSKMSGELNVPCSYNIAIGSMSALNIHSCKVNASSSVNLVGGIYGITTLNVYGGSVDAEYTGSANGYGMKNTNLNIYGGEVKAVGKGSNNNYSYGIAGPDTGTTVKVYGGKLQAVSANKSGINSSYVSLTKEEGFSGKIETSGNGTDWTEYTNTGTPNAPYVRVGY